MEVTLKIHRSLDDALELAAELEAYAYQATREFRDDRPPPGTGERVLRRALEAREGVVLTAHLPGKDERIGYCVTAPLVDPWIGDTSPAVVALFTNSDFRHRGLAGQMVTAARRELEGRGLMTLAALAGHNDDALISMGERWGFVRVYEVMVRE